MCVSTLCSYVSIATTFACAAMSVLQLPLLCSYVSIAATLAVQLCQYFEQFTDLATPFIIIYFIITGFIWMDIRWI